MIGLLDELSQYIERLREQTLHRTLAQPCGIDFSSNDYLGLSTSPDFIERLKARIGDRDLTTPASRLLRGNTAYHTQLESRLASFKGTESALLFPSGYQANVGLLSTIVTRNDRVLSDSLNHASLIDGIRLSGAYKIIYPHADIDSIEKALQAKHSAGKTFIVTESLFSMDGDIVPLDRYADLAEQHHAHLIVDDAHATGIYGAQRGSGLVEEFSVASRATAVISTFGKALGSSGACVAGSTTLIDYLINRCRAFVFSTAPPPLLLTAVDAGLDIVQEKPHLRGRVLRLADRLREALQRFPVQLSRTCSPIVPILIGDAGRTMAVAERVREHGYDVRGVRPPTVPDGTSRIRVSVHANHTEDQVDGLAEAIGLAWEEIAL